MKYISVLLVLNVILYKWPLSIHYVPTRSYIYDKIFSWHILHWSYGAWGKGTTITNLKWKYQNITSPLCSNMTASCL